MTLFLRHNPELATLANKDGATCIDIAAAKGSVAVMWELLSHIDATVLNNKVSRPRVNGYFNEKTAVIPDHVKM